MSDAQREYKKRNLELGLCQDCPGPRFPSSKNFCESCLEKNRARARAYARKKRNFKEWIHSDRTKKEPFDNLKGIPNE